ncbi:MAG: hypothetical protein ACOC2C_05555 [Cyclonatronaceae bacterium]
MMSRAISERVAGLGYVFSNGSKVMFDVGSRRVDRFNAQVDVTRYELLAEIRF